MTELENNTGLLWFDDDPSTTLQAKIRRLKHHYQKKHGVTPQLCYVHKSSLNEEKERTIDGIKIRTRKSVLPHCFWIGRTEKRRKSQATAKDAAMTIDKRTKIAYNLSAAQSNNSTGCERPADDSKVPFSLGAGDG